jgi:hypothetical protein
MGCSEVLSASLAPSSVSERLGNMLLVTAFCVGCGQVPLETFLAVDFGRLRSNYSMKAAGSG